VKFSKQFEAQLVPEWKEAFVDYWQLKKDVKKLQTVARGGAVVPSPWLHYLHQKPPATAHWVMRLPFLHSHGNHREPAAIQVHKKLMMDGSIDGAVAGEVYETGVENGAGFVDAEAAKAFFQRLDQQLNKVNRFYERKEGEFLERGESLRRQLQILIELKAAITQQQQTRHGGGSSKGSADTDDLSISCSIQLGDQSLRGIAEQEEDGQETVTKDVTAKSTDEGLEDQLSISQGLGESGRLGRPNEEAAHKLRTLSGRVVTCQGRNVRINIPVTTPSRTVTAICELLFEDMLSQSKKTGTHGSDSNEKLSINKRKLRQAEKMIRGALVELYKGLGYLKTYRSLNMMAFVKILKKFDKVSTHISCSLMPYPEIYHI